MDSLVALDSQRKNWVERTQTGLLLLIVGSVLCVFPIVRIAGVFVTLWAVALLVESRDGFGSKHSMSIRVGTALFVVGAVLFVLSSSGFVFETYSLATFYQNYQVVSVDFTIFPSAMIRAVPTFLLLDFAGMILLGLSYVTLTYRLQDARGRQLVFLGLAAMIATSFFVFSTLFSAASPLGKQWGIGGWDIPSAWAFEAELFGLSTLNLLPVVIFVVGFRSCYLRLNYSERIPTEKVSLVA